MTGHVATELHPAKGLAVLRLVNPARSNAISSKMWREVAEAARSLAAAKDVRAVVIEGGAQVFSAGADISDFESARSDASSVRTYDDLIEETCRLVEAIPHPTIAAIEGYCFGAGASLAASCDLRVAARDATFAVPAARLGLGYDISGIARFRRVFGPNATAMLLFTAEPLAATDPLIQGGLHRIVAPGETVAAAHALAERIGANAPLTLRAAKAAMRALATGDHDLTRTARALADLADASADYAEGKAAFAEKRRPKFKGT